MAARMGVEVDCGERGASRMVGCCEGVVGEDGFGDEVAAGILREVRGAAVALDPPCLRVEQAGGELRECRLAGTVRAEEPDDLAAVEGQRGVVEEQRAV